MEIRVRKFNHCFKDIEHRVQLEAEALGLQRGFPAVGPANVKGIEINAYAAELARVSVWIGEIQWMRRNGFTEARDPILKPLETIECRDAILAPDGTEPDWPTVDVVMGNPPFLGGKLLIKELGEDCVSRIFAAYKHRVPPEADLVCYWFVKAGQQIGLGKARRAGLVATNSIRGGANRRALQAATEGRPIFEAWSDQPWVIDGAAVRVSLVCFSPSEDSHAPEVRLDGEPVDEIHADLTAKRGGVGIDLTQTKRLSANSGTAFMGDTKSGAFSGGLAREWLRLPANPNGRLAMRSSPATLACAGRISARNRPIANTAILMVISRIVLRSIDPSVRSAACARAFHPRSTSIQKPAMVARPPFLQAVQRTHPDPFVEPSRGDGIVELAVGLGRRALLRAVVGRDVPRIGRHTRLRRRRRPSVRQLRPEKLQPERRDPVPHSPFAFGQRQRAADRAVNNVQIARREDAMLRRVLMPDKGRQVRQNPVRRDVGRADAPRRSCRRMGLHVARIHRGHDEAVFGPVPRRHPGGGNRPDAADADVVLAEFADRRHLPEPFDLDPLRQFDHNGPAVAQLMVPEHVVVGE